MSETAMGQGPELPLGRTARSLPEQLAEILLADLTAGRLQAGDRLKEETLARTHAVSRATVREALILLSKLGYVVRLPRFGARIAVFSPEDVEDLFQLRAALLSAAARRCAHRRDASALSRLEALVGRLEAMAADPATDPQIFATHSVQGQSLLVEWSGNRHLPDLYERLANMGAWQLIRGQATSFLAPDHRMESATDWRRLAEQLRKGDEEGAGSAARSLLEHSARRVREHLEDTIKLRKPNGDGDPQAAG